MKNEKSSHPSDMFPAFYFFKGLVTERSERKEFFHLSNLFGYEKFGLIKRESNGLLIYMNFPLSKEQKKQKQN